MFWHRFMLSLLALVLAAGCASAKITSREELVTEKLPRPGTIWVHDFAATVADVQVDSSLAGFKSDHPAPQSEEEIEIGRQVGAEIATELVGQIRAMGMPAERAAPGTTTRVNDIVIQGYLLSIHEGSKVKRVGIGFGSGASELKTAAEGFQVTAQGLRKLGGGDADAGGSKTPGGVVGLAALIATGNPVGLIVGGGMKVYGEASGKAKIEGRAKQTATEIAGVLKQRFQEQGWILSE